MAQTSQQSLIQLKSDLKAWERAFAIEHGGRKASREDIKACPEIASRYKRYAQLSRPAEKSSRNSRIQHANDSKVIPETQYTHDQVATPRKTDRHPASPRKTPTQPCSPTPQAIRRRLGPTPQRDGQILGLFDTLISATPSKSRTALAVVDSNVAATPSRAQARQDTASTHDKLSRTPVSIGKRFMLDAFVTPSKRKREDGSQTPSKRRGIDSTPQFLRRNPDHFRSTLESLQEDVAGEGHAVERRPFKKRSLVRSLSSIIKGIKAREDAMFDDDLEALREAEAEENAGEAVVRKAPAPKSTPPAQAVESEKADMPLGPDMPDLSSDDSEVEGDVPRKVWKKKGLKRQTKRVKMRPAPRPVQDSQTVSTTDDRVDSAIEVSSPGKENDDPDADYLADPAAAKVNPPQAQDATKKKRKVNELAHTNFCRLKIKNKNSKAKGRGRFGRR